MLERETWLNVFSSTMVEEATNEFNNIFMKHFKIAFPLKKWKKKNLVNAFITKNLLSLSALKQSFFQVFQSSKKPEDEIKYNKCRIEYNRKFRLAKKLYYSQSIIQKNISERKCGKH